MLVLFRLLDGHDGLTDLMIAGDERMIASNLELLPRPNLTLN